MRTIAIIGGTGDLGLGLATRLSRSYRVTIGSRDPSRAAEAAAKVSAKVGVRVLGEENRAAARDSEIAILAIPNLPSDEMLISLKPELSSKLVISPIVPMRLHGGLFAPALESGSAAERVAAVLGTRVAGAFHTVPAARLMDTSRDLDCDVLVTAETRDVYRETAEVVSSVPGLRPLYAGPLRNSRMLEFITPILLDAGKLNRISSPSIKVV